MASKKANTTGKSSGVTYGSTASTDLGYNSDVSLSTQSYLENAVDGSMRLFGLPHQFIDITDPRIGDNSNLGRCFSEKLVMEAPLIYLKPGAPDFLPTKSESEKKDFMARLIDAVSGNKEMTNLFEGMDTNGDVELYYDFKDKYDEMMSKVNTLCRLAAVFLGIQDTKVPWAPSATFGTYDWRYYSFKSIYNDLTFKQKNGSSGGIGAFIKDTISTTVNNIKTDNQWIRFYVDSNASFSEDVSNSTTSSVLESYTEKLEGIAKELNTLSGLSGTDMNGIVTNASSSLDSYLQSTSLLNGNNAISTLMSRITGATSNILSGGNFLIPEVWSDSKYGKNYSFNITLSSPYGCIESKYINLIVPMMHILGLCLPQQLSANTYASPYLVKCYSPGWFNCNYGIISSVSIEKGPDSAWAVGGLPNEIKISLSVTDLYSTLSLPVQPYSNMSTFLTTGMLEFLMVNCGADLTAQGLTSKLEVWANILGGNFVDRFTSIPYKTQNWFKSKIQHLFNII